MASTKRIITFGTFDLFHYGHIALLQRAADLGDELFVGVSTDTFNQQKKGRAPIFSFAERCKILESLKFVDTTFKEESFAQKQAYITDLKADTLVMGSDWAGEFDNLSEFCEVIYLERTPEISSTIIKNTLNRHEPAKAKRFKTKKRKSTPYLRLIS